MKPPSAPSNSSRALHRELLLGAALLTVLLLPFSLLRKFIIDEFDYSSMAWMVAQGRLPYVDFFEHHFPLLYQLLSVFFLFSDDPTTIRWIRLSMLAAPVALAVGMAVLNRSWGRWAMFGSWSIFLLVEFTSSAIEIRPDSFGLALMICSLALVSGRDQISWRRAFLAGVFLGAAVWSAQRVVLYGLPLALPTLVDLIQRLRGRASRDALGHTPWYLAGLALVASGAVVYLVGTGSWHAFWRWCIEWSMEHESVGRRFAWQPSLAPLVSRHLPLVVLALLGWLATLLRPREGLTWRLLLALLPISALLSFIYQSAPYPYSRLPVLAFIGLFSGRGLALVAERVRGHTKVGARRLLQGALAIVALLWLVPSTLGLVRHLRIDNRDQLETLKAIGRLTEPTDHIYANTGSFVSRPPTGFYLFTNAYVRQTQLRTFAREVPGALLRYRTKAILLDGRFGGLAPDLQRYLFGHFVPWNEDLWLWGKRMNGSPTGIDDEFIAIEDGQYFIYPQVAVDLGSLRIDGRLIEEDVFHLAAGPHRVQFEGPEGALAILWLPRDGQRWEPRSDGPPRFSVHFVE